MSILYRRTTRPRFNLTGSNRDPGTRVITRILHTLSFAAPDVPQVSHTVGFDQVESRLEHNTPDETSFAWQWDHEMCEIHSPAA